MRSSLSSLCFCSTFEFRRLEPKTFTRIYIADNDVKNLTHLPRSSFPFAARSPLLSLSLALYVSNLLCVLQHFHFVFLILLWKNENNIWQHIFILSYISGSPSLSVSNSLLFAFSIFVSRSILLNEKEKPFSMAFSCIDQFLTWDDDEWRICEGIKRCKSVNSFRFVSSQDPLPPHRYVFRLHFEWRPRGTHRAQRKFS